jgi:hypothetical protein
MTSGYATFFALWSQSELYLSPFEDIWSITLLAIFASIFVLHEAISMIFESLKVDRRNKVLIKAKF